MSSNSKLESSYTLAMIIAIDDSTSTNQLLFGCHNISIDGALRNYLLFDCDNISRDG